MLQTVGGGGGGGFMDLQIIFWNFLKIFKKRIIRLYAVDYPTAQTRAKISGSNAMMTR